MMAQWQAPVQSPLSSWLLEAERLYTGISDLSCVLFLSSKNLLLRAQRRDRGQGWIWVWSTGVCSCTQPAVQKRSQAAEETQELRICLLNEWHGLLGVCNSQINAKSTTTSCSTSAKPVDTSNKVFGNCFPQCVCNHGLLAIQAVELHRICGSILSTHRASFSTKGNQAVQRNSIQLHSSAVPRVLRGGWGYTLKHKFMFGRTDPVLKCWSKTTIH